MGRDERARAAIRGAANNVSCWHLADVSLALANVGFWGRSGHPPMSVNDLRGYHPRMRGQIQAALPIDAMNSAALIATSYLPVRAARAD